MPPANASRLLCVENDDDAFVAAARELIAGGCRRIAFLPLAERAKNIIRALGPGAETCELVPWSDGEAADAVLLPIASGEELSSALLRFLDRDGIRIVAPQTDWYFKSRPLYLISIPKAGTHLLYELAKAFGYAEGVAGAPEATRPGHWYCVEYSNSHTSARDFFIDTVRRSPFGNRAHPFLRSPAIFIYRNPRDILLSEANYYHKDGNSPLAGYLSRLSPSERLLRLIDDPWLLGSFRDRMAQFVPWLEMPNVIPISFEELVGPEGGGDAAIQRRLIWSLQLKLQIPGDPSDYASQVFDRASPTFFAGRIGAGRERFAPDAEARFAALPQDFMAAFGFAPSADGSTPVYSTRMEEFRRRGLAFSKADFRAVPITLEYEFLGFNLVQFGGRVYAVAESLGPVDLATLPADELARLPSAKTLDAAKYLVAGGRAPTMRAPPIGAAPKLIESFGGYNIVAYEGRYHAALRHLGAVDLADPASRERFAAQAPHALLAADSIGEVRERIGRVLAEARLQALEEELATVESGRRALLAEVERNAVAIHDLKEQVERLRRGLVNRILGRLARMIFGDRMK